MDVFSFLTDQGITVPTIKIVCPECRGTGTTVNPAIDGNGLTSEDFAEYGDDFREDYFAGHYDIRCEECNGANVIDDLDREIATSEQINAWNEFWQDHYEYQAEIAAERRYFGYS